jgi:RimJ/RimL family protein N-acetyltransferase
LDTPDIYIEDDKQNDKLIDTEKQIIIKEHSIVYPSTSDKSFLSFYNDKNNHFVIYDQVIKKPIGMFSLTDNIPKYLTIRISNLWITPAYNGKKKGHETILLILQELFKQGYRRVTFEVNSKNVIMRKFLERCGFVFESVIRKHKIILGRNRDTYVYAVLNSEFIDCEIKLKKYLGLDIVPKKKKAADLTVQILPTLDDRDNELFRLFDADATSKRNDKKKSKKSKK